MRWDDFSQIGRLLLVVGILLLTIVMCLFMIISGIELLLDKGSVLSAEEMRGRLEQQEDISLKGSRLAIDKYRVIYVEDEKIGYAKFEMTQFFQSNVYVYTVSHELVGYFIALHQDSMFQGVGQEDLVLGYVSKVGEQYVFYSRDLEVIAVSEDKTPHQIQDLSGTCLFEVEYRYDFWRNEERYEIKKCEDSELDVMQVIWMIFMMDVKEH